MKQCAEKPSPELLEANTDLCVMDAADQAKARVECVHDYVQDAGAAWSLVTRNGDRANMGFKMVTLNGPQGEYQLEEPRNSREARLVPDSDLWFNAEVMHVSELEGGGILRPVERHEAEGYKIYPSQIEYTLQKNQEDGTLKKRKVRGCLNGKSWEGDMTGMYAPGAARDTVMLQIADAQRKGHRRLKMDIKNAYLSRGGVARGAACLHAHVQGAHAVRCERQAYDLRGHAELLGGATSRGGLWAVASAPAGGGDRVRGSAIVHGDVPPPHGGGGGGYALYYRR